MLSFFVSFLALPLQPIIGLIRALSCLMPGSIGLRAKERRQVRREAKEIATLQKIADKQARKEAKLYGQIIPRALSRLGAANWESAGGKVRIRRIRIDACNIEPETISYHILSTKEGLLGGQDTLPQGVRLAFIADPATLYELSHACMRPVTAIDDSYQSGMWLVVHRNERIDGLVNLLRFSEIKDAYPRDMSHAPIIVGTKEHRVLATVDFEHNPHWLVSGTTGSGKSNFINNLLCGLIRYTDRNETLLILIDLKGMEFPFYKNAPQLLLPVVTDIEPAIEYLRWVKRAIKYRATMMGAEGAKNLIEWNQLNPNRKMARLIILMDEFAELTTAADSDDRSYGKQAKALTATITALGRSVGIHTVVATQHPSVEVIPNILKVNMAALFAGKTISPTQSMVVIGTGAASKLPNVKGRMLMVEGAEMEPIQTPLITNDEIRESVNMAIGRAEHLTTMDLKIDSEGLIQWLVDKNGGLIPDEKTLWGTLSPYGVPKSEISAFLEGIRPGRMVAGRYGVYLVQSSPIRLIPQWEDCPDPTEIIPIFGLPPLPTDEEMEARIEKAKERHEVEASPEPPEPERDPIERWIEDRCHIYYSNITPVRILHDDYKEWCEENQVYPLHIRQFSIELADKQGVKKKIVEKKASFIGISIRSRDKDEIEETNEVSEKDQDINE